MGRYDPGVVAPPASPLGEGLRTSALATPRRLGLDLHLNGADICQDGGLRREDCRGAGRAFAGQPACRPHKKKTKPAFL